MLAQTLAKEVGMVKVSTGAAFLETAKDKIEEITSFLVTVSTRSGSAALAGIGNRFSAELMSLKERLQHTPENVADKVAAIEKWEEFGKKQVQDIDKTEHLGVKLLTPCDEQVKRQHEIIWTDRIQKNRQFLQQALPICRVFCSNNPQLAMQFPLETGDVSDVCALVEKYSSYQSLEEESGVLM